MTDTPLTYTSAMEELHQIVQRMQDAETPIDELPAQVRRAGELITFCREKLRGTETALEKLLTDEPTT